MWETIDPKTQKLLESLKSNYAVYEKGKKIIFIGYEENMAWELRQCWHMYINRIRDIVGRDMRRY